MSQIVYLQKSRDAFEKEWQLQNTKEKREARASRHQPRHAKGSQRSEPRSGPPKDLKPQPQPASVNPPQPAPDRTVPDRFYVPRHRRPIVWECNVEISAGEQQKLVIYQDDKVDAVVRRFAKKFNLKETLVDPLIELASAQCPKDKDAS
jgi:hypothetical protein